MAQYLTTFAAQVTSTGIFAPAYADILYTLTQQFAAIYGADVVTDPSTQDMQWLGILARGYYDCGQAAVAAYNSFRPSGAIGVGLSTVVKINGLARLVASNSQVPALIVGTAGTGINNGLVVDPNGNQWALPASVTIPTSGQITETLTAVLQGSTALASGVALTIFTPVPGWQTITTTSAATVGAPVETDAALRIRQAQSTSLPALTVLDAIVANVQAVTGVIQVQPYENDTGSTNAMGIPAHSISIVVLGGGAVQIATAIADTKSPGTGTYGTTSEIITDQNGVPDTINFYFATQIQVYAITTITPFAGYVSTTGTAILATQQAYANNLEIGQNLYMRKFSAVTELYGDAATGSSGQTQAALDLLSETYDVSSIYLARSDMTVTSAITVGSATFSIGNAASLSVGSQILLTDIGGGTEAHTISAISGTLVTISTVTTGTVSAGSLVYVMGSLTTAFNEILEVTNVSQLTLVT